MRREAAALREEIKLHLGYRWFCRLELDDKIPDHSTLSVNRHGRFRDSDILRQVFEAVVRACMMQVLSRARALRSMQASSKPMPAVIMARLQARLTGRHPSARRAQSRSSLRPLMMKALTQIASRQR